MGDRRLGAMPGRCCVLAVSERADGRREAVDRSAWESWRTSCVPELRRMWGGAFPLGDWGDSGESGEVEAIVSD